MVGISITTHEMIKKPLCQEKSVLGKVKVSLAYGRTLGKGLRALCVLPQIGRSYATIPHQNMYFVKGKQRLQLMAEYATSSINMRFRYHRVLRSLIIPATLELSQFNGLLRGGALFAVP